MTIDRNWYSTYLNRYRASIFESDVYEELIQFKNICEAVKNSSAKIMIAGNGASAAIASHAAADFTKQARVPSVTFHDPDFITMMANDFGYENWLAESIQVYHNLNDIVVLISSSGTSKNIINAALRARELGLTTISFTGFGLPNELTELSNVSFNLNSKAYNVIENTHSIWITTVVDMILGKAEYGV